jgi:hypothetical protein
MGTLIRWMIEFWIIRFIFRWLWRAVILATLVIGVAFLGGQGGNLKHWLFDSGDTSQGSPGAAQASVEHTQALEHPAVTMIRAGLQQDQEAIHKAAQLAKPMMQRVGQQVYDPLGEASHARDEFKSGTQHDGDGLGQQLESLRNSKDSSTPYDSNGGQ